MRFVNYSSVFNTIVPAKLVPKLRILGHLPLQLDPGFPDSRAQVVRMGNLTSPHWSPSSTQAPPLHPDCVATHSSNITLKFAGDITILGLISNDLATWRQDNSLSLNVCKAKEIIMDLEAAGGSHDPLHIDGA